MHGPSSRRTVRRSTALLGVAALAVTLSACVPAYNAAYRTGRIVNVTTGAEGQIALGGAGSLSGRNTASVTFGADVYRGEYNLLSGVSPAQVGVGSRFGFGISSAVGFYVVAPSPVRPEDGLRSANAIVRNAQNRVISCDFVFDRFDRGNGTCTDGAGQRYSVQF